MMSSTRLVTALGLPILSLVIAVPPASGQCVGDCDGRGSVEVAELVRGVEIALGLELLSVCTAFDRSANGQLSIDELLQGVVAVLTDCRRTFPVDGICLRPGPTGLDPSNGLDPCREGTDVRIGMCKDRQLCLSDPSKRKVLEFGKIGPQGLFSFELDSATVAQATLVYEADVEPATATTYRVIGFGGIAAGAGAGIDDDVLIDPNTEAAVRLVDESGLGSLSDEGVEAVIQTVQAANANLSFAGLEAAAAATMATDEASQDAAVTTAIEEAVVTPLLVTNLMDNTVSIVDARTNKGLFVAAVGMNPLGIALTPDGDYAFVVNRGGSATTESFSIIGTRSRTVHTFAAFDSGTFDQSVGVAIDPRGIAYVANRNTGSVDVIDVFQAIDLLQAMEDPSSARVTRITGVGGQPTMVAAARSEPLVYVSLETGNGVVVIGTSDNEVMDTVNLPSGAVALALTPDDNMLYVARRDTGSGVGHVSVVRTHPPELVPPEIEVGLQPIGVAVAPAGDFAYIVTSGKSSESLAVIDTGSQSVVGTVALPPNSAPLGIAVSPDGRNAYVGLRNAASLLVVDTEKARSPDPSGAVVATVPVGRRPQVVAVTNSP